MTKRLFIFEPFPVQYHAPVYRALAEAAAEEVEIEVIYATDSTLRGKFDPGFARNVAWDEPLLEGYRSRLVPDRWPWKIPWLLAQQRPTAVMLTDFNHRISQVAYLSCLLLGIPVWIRTETQDEAFARGAGRTLVRKMAYGVLYAAASHCFAIGEANHRHYARHGVPRRRISYSRYCVTDRFGSLSSGERHRLRADLRRRLGWDENLVGLLFCGKFQRKKNPGCLLEALQLMDAAARRRFGVLYVGSGEGERELREQARALTGVAVHFAGFKNQSELPPYYLASDVLILPSRQMGETWGLVVNEALLADRRAILSPHVGCLGDFGVLPSVVAFDGKPAGLRRALESLPPATSTAANSAFMAEYSVARAAQGIRDRMAAEREEGLCA